MKKNAFFISLLSFSVLLFIATCYAQIPQKAIPQNPPRISKEPSKVPAIKNSIKKILSLTHKVDNYEFRLISSNPGELYWFAITVDGVRKLYTYGGESDVEYKYYKDVFNLIKAANQNLNVMIFESEHPPWCSNPYANSDYWCEENPNTWLTSMEEWYKDYSPEFQDKVVDAKFLLGTYVIEPEDELSSKWKIP